MNIEEFINKTYTAAFRLTGEEKPASDIALHAIERTSIEFDNEKQVPSNMFKNTVLEVCKIFLQETHLYTSEALKYPFRTFGKQKQDLLVIQKAILNLEPLKRVTVTWRDILGFKLAEITSLVNLTEEQLYKELSNARRQLKEQLNQNL